MFSWKWNQKKKEHRNKEVNVEETFENSMQSEEKVADVNIFEGLDTENDDDLFG